MAVMWNLYQLLLQKSNIIAQKGDFMLDTEVSKAVQNHKGLQKDSLLFRTPFDGHIPSGSYYSIKN